MWQFSNNLWCGVTAGVHALAAGESNQQAARRSGGWGRRHVGNGIQIKGRAFGESAKRSQRVGAIRAGAPCDRVLLVLLDNGALEPREMWEAPMAKFEERLALPGSKARERGSLSVGEFKRLAERVWPLESKGDCSS